MTRAGNAVPGYEAMLWLSVSGPAGMPPEIVHQLYNAITKALQDPELQHSFRNAGVEAISMPPEEFNRYIASEYEKWGRVVKETGATVN